MVSFNRRIVRILEEAGLVEMDVLVQASQVANQQEKSVSEFLLNRKIFEENDLLGILAERLGVPPIDLRLVDQPSELTEVVSRELAQEIGCVPIAKMGHILTVAVSNPFDVVKHDDLRLKTGCELRLALALEPQIEEAQRKFYDRRDNALAEIEERDVHKAGTVNVVIVQLDKNRRNGVRPHKSAGPGHDIHCHVGLGSRR